MPLLHRTDGARRWTPTSYWTGTPSAVAWVLISRGIAAPPPNRAAAPPKRPAELANVVALAHADPRAPILVVGVTGNTALVDLRFTEFHANAVDRLAVHDDPVRQADGSVHVNDPVVAPPAAFSRRDREKADVDTAAVALFGDGVPDSLRSVARTITKAAFPAMTGRHTWLAGHEVQSEDRTTLITISKELIMSFPAGRAALQEYCELHHFNPVACTTILTDLGHRTQQGQKRKRNASTSSDYEERDRLRASWSVVVPEPVTQRNPEYEAFSASYAPTPAK